MSLPFSEHSTSTVMSLTVQFQNLCSKDPRRWNNPTAVAAQAIHNRKRSKRPGLAAPADPHWTFPAVESYNQFKRSDEHPFLLFAWGGASMDRNKFPQNPRLRWKKGQWTCASPPSEFSPFLVVHCAPQGNLLREGDPTPCWEVDDVV